MDGYEVKCLPNGYFQHLETINNILFTAREIDIISCIAHMRGSSKIASLLDVATKTVETHINNIKNKIDNNVREGIIDFIEKSGKSAIIRKHYQNLLIKADFNKKLRSLSNTISNSSAVCYFFCSDPKNNKSIISNIQNHLKIAGIKLRTCAINEEIINYQPKDHFIYVVSAKPGNKTFIIKALQEYKRHPNLFTFLVAEELDNELMLELADIPYINFLQYETSMIKHVNHPQIMKTQQQPGITALS